MTALDVIVPAAALTMAVVMALIVRATYKRERRKHHRAE
jgi:hypothetical protein